MKTIHKAISTLNLLLLTTQAVSQTCPNFTYTTPPSPWPVHFSDSVQNMLTPAESRACVQVPPGFRADLWASEEDEMGGIQAIVAMNWDEKGRLWGAETFDYPHEISTPFAGNDRIVIVEDTDNDGTADNLKVFVDNLNLVTSLVHTSHGLVVAMSPHIVLFEDNNGDDIADNPQGRILFTGFGRSDTHASLSNLMYGLDNWIYANNGYSAGNVEGNVMGQKLFRFKSDGSAFQVLSTTTNNTWGSGLSEGGQIFVSTANQHHSYHQVYPGVLREIPDHSSSTLHHISAIWNHNNPGYCAASNHSLYTARHFPQRYWDRSAFVCDATAHLCHQDFLVESNSSWTATEDNTAYNIFANSDAWSAPIQAHVGPDGALWVLDWYNFYISHSYNQPLGPGNAELSPLRDNEHNRIYRVVHTASPLNTILDLSQASEDDLLATLNHPNLLWRLHAQRLLLRNGSNPSLIDKLWTILQARNVTLDGQAPLVVHAIRVLEGLGIFETDGATWVPRLGGLMLHPSTNVRWSAIDALPLTTSSTTTLLSSGRINDPDAHVRLRALYKLTLLPGSISGDMYNNYVTTDTYSQTLFNNIETLTSVGTLPNIPPLDAVVSIEQTIEPTRPVHVAFSPNKGIVISGLKEDFNGTLTLWNTKGRRRHTTNIQNGMITEKLQLHEGFYFYTIEGNSNRYSGKISLVDMGN